MSSEFISVSHKKTTSHHAVHVARLYIITQEKGYEGGDCGKTTYLAEPMHSYIPLGWSWDPVCGQPGLASSTYMEATQYQRSHHLLWVVFFIEFPILTSFYYFFLHF